MKIVVTHLTRMQRGAVCVAGLDVVVLRDQLQRQLPDVERKGRSAIAQWLTTAAVR